MSGYPEISLNNPKISLKVGKWRGEGETKIEVGER
jgi:hypothetical protein